MILVRRKDELQHQVAGTRRFCDRLMTQVPILGRAWVFTSQRTHLGRSAWVALSGAGCEETKDGVSGFL